MSVLPVLIRTFLTELKDDAPFETLDALRDPAEAAKHLEL